MLNLTFIDRLPLFGHMLAELSAKVRAGDATPQQLDQLRRVYAMQLAAIAVAAITAAGLLASGADHESTRALLRQSFGLVETAGAIVALPAAVWILTGSLAAVLSAAFRRWSGAAGALEKVALAVNPIRALPWFGIGVILVLTAKATPYLFG